MSKSALKKIKKQRLPRANEDTLSRSEFYSADYLVSFEDTKIESISDKHYFMNELSENDPHFFDNSEEIGSTCGFKAVFVCNSYAIIRVWYG